MFALSHFWGGGNGSDRTMDLSRGGQPQPHGPSSGWEKNGWGGAPSFFTAGEAMEEGGGFFQGVFHPRIFFLGGGQMRVLPFLHPVLDGGVTHGALHLRVTSRWSSRGSSSPLRSASLAAGRGRRAAAGSAAGSPPRSGEGGPAWLGLAGSAGGGGGVGTTMRGRAAAARNLRSCAPNVGAPPTPRNRTVSSHENV